MFAIGNSHLDMFMFDKMTQSVSLIYAAGASIRGLLNKTSTTIFNNLNNLSTNSTLSINNLNNTSTTIFNNLIVNLLIQHYQLII